MERVWHERMEVDGVAATHDEYEQNRTALLARWWDALVRVRRTGKISPGGYERQVASSYLLLKTGWEPERITPTIEHAHKPVHRGIWIRRSHRFV